MRTRVGFLILALLSGSPVISQTLCDAQGNVVVFSNYDGGALTINVDVNIPNLKIGICTYEDCQVTITGPFAGNVTAVRYAGFQGNNDHCNLGLTGTTVTGVPAGIVTVLFAPPVTLADPNGYSSIICGYSCEPGNQGGCNTATQIADYFVDNFGGSLRSYYTQYGCWPAGAINVSNGGNCCPGTTTSVTAAFSLSDQTICPGDCITAINESTGGPTSWTWTFTGGTPATSNQQNPGVICYNTPGTYPVTLTVSSAGGNSTATASIVVENCPVPGCTYPQALNFSPLANDDDGSCEFGPCQGCAGDLDGNGFVGVNDLLQFIAVFGTFCPE